MKTYLNCLMPEKLDSIELDEPSLKKIEDCLSKIETGQIKECRNSEQLFDYVLDFWGHLLFSSEDQFKEVINLLMSTQKGLTRGEILSIAKADPEELKLFFVIFRPFIMNFHSLWMIKNDSFKAAI